MALLSTKSCKKCVWQVTEANATKQSLGVLELGDQMEKYMEIEGLEKKNPSFRRGVQNLWKDLLVTTCRQGASGEQRQMGRGECSLTLCLALFGQKGTGRRERAKN